MTAAGDGGRPDPQALAGLDDVPWGRRRHAYGSARQVPDLLRGLWDPERAEQCADDLLMSLYHQGGVRYSAAEAALPFLVRAAVAPEAGARHDLVHLIGDLASEAPADAWRTLLPALLGLLDDDDVRVRAAAVDVVARTALDADAVAAALTARFDAEPEVVVRAHAVRAVAELVRADRLSAPKDAVAWLATAAADPSLAPLPELARRYATRDTSAVDAAALAARVRSADWSAVEGEPTTWRHAVSTVAGLLCDAPAARRDVAARLLADASGEVRAAAARELAVALVTSRAGQAELAARLAARVRDPEPEVRLVCAHVCAALREVAAGAAAGLADDLAALLDDPSTAGHGRRTTVAAVAAWGLARLGDPRCVPFLRRALERDGAPYGVFFSGYYDAGAYVVELPGVHEVAGLLPGSAAELLPAVVARLERGVERGESHHPARAYAQLVTAWGPAGAPAAGALVALLPTGAGEWAAEALGAVGPAAAEAGPALATAARRARDRGVRVAAAAAHRAVTGDDALALAVLPPALRTIHAETAARQLAAIGPAARPHLGRLRRLSVRASDPRVRVAAAYAVARIGDEPVPDVVTGLLRDALDGADVHPVLAEAVHDVADVGPPPAARPWLEALLATDRRVTPRGGWNAFDWDATVRRDAARALGAPGP